MGRQKDLVCESFYNTYKDITNTKRNTFSRLCNRLLNDNFIYGQKPEDKQDYYLILEYKELITNYFEMIDYNLVYDDNYKIFFIETMVDRNRKNLSKLDTIALIILRLLYYRGSLNINEGSNIVITLRTLIDEINTTGIYKTPVSKTDYVNTLRMLKKVKVINSDLKNDRITDETTIEIYPTILYVVRTDDIQLLNNKIQAFVAEKNDKIGDYEDETEED